MAKVLVADDDPQLLQLLAAFVQQLGHTPVSAAEGDAAMKLFESENPVAAIVDVMMPRVAGQAVCIKMKRKNPNIGVLLISGVYTDPAFVETAPKQYGCDGYILKPFTGEQITKVFRPILDKALESAGASASAPAAVAATPAPVAASPSGANPAAAKPAVAANVWAKRDPNEVAATASAAAAVAAAMAGNKRARSAEADPVSAAAAAVLGTAPPAPPAQDQVADGIPLEGNLEKMSVLALLYRCSADSLSGKLTFKKDVATKEIWIKGGKLLHASSNIESDRIEFRLKAAGKMTPEQYADLQTVAKAFGGSMEAALLNLKIVQGGEIFELSKETAQSLVLDVFRWMGGRYSWAPGAPFPAANTGLSVPLEELISRGLKELDGSALYRALGTRLRGSVDKDLVGMANIDRLKLSPAEFRLSRMIDGRKSPETIAKEWAAGDQGKELRGLQIVYLMAEAGMVRLNEALDDKRAAAQAANAAATAAGAPDPEIDTLKKKLAELEKQNFFDVLGVTRSSAPADVKKAYFKLAKQYHPDTLPPDAAADRRKLVDSIFAVISQAQKVLEDPKQREAYVSELDAKESGTDGSAAEAILMAEMEFQKAEVMLKKKDLPNARKHLTEALKLNPNEAEHHVYWGWLIWLETKKQQDAVKHIETGLKMRANVSAAWLFLGHIYKALNDLEKAERAYRKCISLDDKNQEAMSELRVMQMRKGKK